MNKNTVVITVKGEGVSPCKNNTCSSAQGIVLARRAAIVDAYKNLAEKIYGIKIEGRDTVQNMILQNSELKSYVEGQIKGANIEKEYYKDGVYVIFMSLKINVQEWNNYINSSY